ncbi:MAG: hypothetical protein FJ037_03735 [Chloroflexi bacterium]|nr:hypothetical protein [Chloroflexota bacterium]
MIALAALLGLGAALVQGGPLGGLGDGGAAIALPSALATGWASVRGPREAIVLVFVAAAILGVLSDARVGLFALALMPAAVTGTLATIGVPGRRTRVARAALAGWLGAAAYLLLLAVTAGGLPGGTAVAWGLAASAFIAATTCLALFPWRPNDRRLFA